jgi:acetyl-CoA C-acetyltransferase
MDQSISIIGTGQTPFGEHWDKSLQGLIAESVNRALENAPCTPLDIDMVIVANMIGERLSGQAHLGAMTAAMLPHHPPALRVEAACASGAVAMHTACALLESGKAQTILVVGAEKMTDATTEEVAAALMGAADSEKDAPSGITFPGLFGLVAQRYMHEYNLSREDLSCVSALHHRNAVGNPFAQFRKAISPEEISASGLVADPLRLLDCSPVSDGAAACILSTKFQGPVRIAASQLATDAVSLVDRPSITSFRATKHAMEKALQEAQIGLQDIQAVELHDCFSIAAIISVEDMGFAEPGTGVQLYKKENTGLILNPSGGLKACGHPVAATGVKQVIEVSKYLQAQKAQWGVAHNFGGTGATCGVHILEYRHG